MKTPPHRASSSHATGITLGENVAFDANIYAQLNAANPAAAQAYLQAETQQQAPAQPPAPAAAPLTFQAPPTPQFTQPQGLPQYQNTAQAQPAQELARGTLEDFFNQRSAVGGASLMSYFGSANKGNKKPQGSWIQLTVTRDVTHADVRQQTEFGTGVPVIDKKTNKPKFDLVMPVAVNGASVPADVAALFEDGNAVFYVKPGVLKDELSRSMATAGVSGFPKKGDQIVVISAGEKPNRNFQPTRLYDFQYARPATDPTAAVQAAPVVETPAAPVAPAPVDPTAQPAATSAPAPAAPPAAPPATGPSAPAASTLGAPVVAQTGETREELLARLRGGQ